jgi:hypothetical protein
MKKYKNNLLSLFAYIIGAISFCLFTVSSESGTGSMLIALSILMFALGIAFVIKSSVVKEPMWSVVALAIIGVAGLIPILISAFLFFTVIIPFGTSIH